MGVSFILIPEISNAPKIQNFLSANLTSQVENSIPRSIIFYVASFEVVYKITFTFCV